MMASELHCVSKTKASKAGHHSDSSGPAVNSFVCNTSVISSRFCQKQ